MSLYQYFKSNGPTGFGYGSTAEQVTEGLNLDGKTVLVTGCNSGLGGEVVRVLALRGAKVVATARTEAKARAACEPVKGGTVPQACELSEPNSVRACVEAVKQKGLRLDAIICNAGVMAIPQLELAQGYEAQFFTNHVGHFMLVTGLLGHLTENARVVVVSSSAHQSAPKGGIEFDNLKGEKSYVPWVAYGQSKFANVLFARELARRFAGTAKTANAVHPGVVATNLWRNMPAWGNAVFKVVGKVALKDVPQGAATEVYVAVHPKAATITGQYWQDCNVARSRPDAEDAELARKLWDVTETIVAGL